MVHEINFKRSGTKVQEISHHKDTTFSVFFLVYLVQGLRSSLCLFIFAARIDQTPLLFRT